MHRYGPTMLGTEFFRLNFGLDGNKNCLSNSKVVQMRANA